MATVRPWAAVAGRAPRALATDLESFAQLVAKWQRVQNLVSRETGDLWPRHIADSLQLLAHLRPADRAILDLGSGGGFPAIPLAIALKEREVEFTLVESNTRKASFLKTVARELGLRAKVLGGRIEALDPAKAGVPDVITARALAPLTQLCELAAPFFGPQTRALLLKGAEFRAEMTEASHAWQFDVLLHKSRTNSDGVVLELSSLRRR